MAKAKMALITLIHVVKRIAKRFHTDNLTAYSAQAAFFVFISFFPFLMLILNLLQYLPFSIEDIDNGTGSILSSKITTMIMSVISDANKNSQGALISITTIAALWAASKGVLAVIRGLDSVYSVSEKRGFIKMRIISLLYTLAFIFILIVTLILVVFGNSILNAITEAAPFLDEFTQLLGLLRWLIMLLCLILFFMFIYTVVPERKTKFKNELPGAVVSALGWIGFSFLFSFYIDNIANYSNIYGSLTAIVILMLWLYACILILFFGAELNDFLLNVNLRRLLSAYRRRKGENQTKE